MMQSALRGFLAALLLACLPGLAGAEGAGLFSADDGAISLRQAPERLLREDSFPGGKWQGEWRGESAGGAGELRGEGLALGGAASSAALRSRVAEVDLGQLESARLGVEGNRLARLGLNLFADVDFQAVFERSAPTASGYTLTGRLADDPFSTAVLAVNGEWVAGKIWAPGGIYSVAPLGGGVAIVRQMRPFSLAHCGWGWDAPEGRRGPFPSEAGPPGFSRPLGRTALTEAAPSPDAFPPDDGSVIDLLVVYPSFVRRSVGGHSAMRALIDSDMAMLNEALRVGGAVPRFNLVAAVEARRTPLEGSSMGYNGANHELTYHVRHGTSGYMDEVPALRDSYAADFVLVHTGQQWGGENTGAFSVSSSGSFAHELGHGMQLQHPRLGQFGDRGNIPFPYSHGYTVHLDFPLPGGEQFFSTIMGGGSIPRFSNARQRYPDERGVPLGVPGDEPSNSPLGPADAVRSMNNTRRIEANYRPSASRCAYALPPAPEELSAADREFRIGVRAGSGCAWSAFSNDEFVSVADGSSGAGDGEVVFQVSANAGWEREAAVFVAGEAYLIRQAAGRERRMTPVCERAPAVRDALATAAGKPCAEVSAADLASVRSLDLSGRGIGSEGAGRLAPGAFDGLLGMASLSLRGNELTRLEPGLFDGLIGLRSLDLSYNNLEALVLGVFDGLPNLLSLDLRGNGRLTDLEPGAFRGLSNLLDLSWSGVGVRVLKRGAFDGLSSLSFLHAPVVAVEPGAFGGLSNLLTLHMSVEDPAVRLAPGLFEGLSNLVNLSVANSSQGALALEEGLFDGLAQLRKLRLTDFGLKTLPPGLFNGLAKLERLVLHASELETLHPRLFNGLTELRSLSVAGGKLKTLPPGLFDGLTRLHYLHLSDNELTALPPDLFHDLSSRGGGRLGRLHLNGNNLTELHPKLFYGMHYSLQDLNLADNGLTDIDPALFEGLLADFQAGREYIREYGYLKVLSLANNRLAALEPSLFRHMIDLEFLNLAGNQLGALPPGLFEGTIHLRELDLWGNPGAPFVFRPELVPLPSGRLAPGGAVEVAAKVAEGAPFDMRIRLQASGGALSARETLIPTGRVLGDAVVVTPDGVGPVTVRALAPVLPGASPCRVEEFDVNPTGERCLGGIRMSAGIPLILHGLPDQTLAPDGAVRFDLPTAFRDFGEGTAYAIESSNPAAVEALIREGLLIVSAAGGGETTLTVTATSLDGRQETRRFAVRAPAAPKVEQPLRSRWGGWRSALLNPPSSEDGDES